HGLESLRGKAVGTLGGTIAYEILLAAEQKHGIRAVSYEDDVHPFSDLVIGRLDGVLLDNVLAERRKRSIPGFSVQPDALATGHYTGILSPSAGPLRDSVNEILRGAMRDGTLEQILRRWNVWDDRQPRLFAQVLAGQPVAPVSGTEDLVSAA